MKSNNRKFETKDKNSTDDKFFGKKKKYVSIYSNDTNAKDTVLVSGRYKCDCEALKHKLINNCSSCGRIVCEQEGSGPCSFCGNLVYTKEERQILNRGTKKSETLHNSLKNAKRIDSDSQNSLKKAIDHKNKLLEYDQTSEERTRVFDDQSDYFQTNSKWIHPLQKEKLEKLEKECYEKKYDRSHKNIIIDLLGRKLEVELDPGMNMPEEDIKEQLKSYRSNYNSGIEPSTSQWSLDRPVYIEGTTSQKSTYSNVSMPMKISRIQDKEIKEMCDDGMCLSMHQPWASLLVMGIKKHEGRVWYSSHRGRLWIASAARAPLEDEVANVQNMYRSIYKNNNISFPKNYPTGCLLGCVQVEDVLPQEEYQNLYPNRESESPYVFVCNNAIEMPVKFPMKGEYKIYKINSQVHKAARNSIKGVMN